MIKILFCKCKYDTIQELYIQTVLLLSVFPYGDADLNIAIFNVKSYPQLSITPTHYDYLTIKFW